MRLTPIIFIVAILLAVASVPHAIGQTFTTMTNVLTTTGLYTTNIYSTSTVGTTTETVASESTIVSTTDTIVVPAGAHFCLYDYWNITISPGTTEVTGTIGPPSSEIDFMIMNQNQYYDFAHYGGCEGVWSAEAAVYSLTSTYNLTWNNPAPGWYYFIFLNEKLGPASTGAITPFVLVATVNQVQTSTVVNVVTNQVTGSETQAFTSLQVTQLPSGIGVGSGMNLGIIAGIVILVIIVAVAVLLLKSRRKSQGTGGPREGQKPTVTKKTKGKGLCINCGKPLPVGSKFCNACGANQE